MNDKMKRLLDDLETAKVLDQDLTSDEVDLFLDEVVRFVDDLGVAKLSALLRERSATPLLHIESPSCFCGPTLDYVDPETGNEVWVHRKAS